MSNFDLSQAYILNPVDGGGQDLNALKDLRSPGTRGQAPFDVIVCNTHDYDPRTGAWDEVFRNGKALGFKFTAWGRVYNVANRLGCSNADAVHHITETAMSPNFPFGGNIEYDIEGDELHAPDYPQTIAAIESDVRSNKLHLDWRAGCSTEPRMADVLANTWLVRYLVMELQMYPQSSTTSQNPRWCRSKAYSMGARRVQFLMGVKDQGKYTPPSTLPALQSPYSMYSSELVDYKPNRYDEWKPQAFAPLPIKYTGPISPTSRASNTIKALKIALYNAGFFWHDPATPFNPDRRYNKELESALIRMKFQFGQRRPNGNYGTGAYAIVRRLQSATPGEGYALNNEAIALIKSDG